jgi:hypothetical protein
MSWFFGLGRDGRGNGEDSGSREGREDVDCLTGESSRSMISLSASLAFPLPLLFSEAFPFPFPFPPFA